MVICRRWAVDGNRLEWSGHGDQDFVEGLQFAHDNDLPIILPGTNKSVFVKAFEAKWSSMVDVTTFGDPKKTWLVSKDLDVTIECDVA